MMLYYSSQSILRVLLTYIHELIGDIFAAKQEVEKSIEQYMLADEKYDDQQSKSIIAMKIADLES